MELSRDDPIFDVESSLEMLNLDVVAVLPGTIRRQVGEDHDERLVDSILAVTRLSLQENFPVTVHELDDILRVPVADVLRGEPQCPRFLEETGPAEAVDFIELTARF